jgi:hypothetical protein
MATLTNTRKSPLGGTILSPHQLIVQEMAVTLGQPPVVIDATYAQKCHDSAQFLGVATSNSVPASSPIGNSGGPSLSMVLKNSALADRNAVFDIVDEINASMSKFSSMSVQVTNNPFVQITQINVQTISSAVADQLVADMLTLLSALNSLDPSGQGSTTTTAQLSSVRISVDGYGGSGNPAADITAFDAGSPYIAQQKALAALSVFDFTKRTPIVVFTANYAPDQGTSSKGCIIGWRTIPEASGYTLTRTDVFGTKQAQISVNNAALAAQASLLDDYVSTWIINFYDDLTAEDLCLYLDSSISTDSYYFYTVQAYRSQMPDTASIFNVPTAPINLSAAQVTSIKSQLISADPSGQADSVNPWPVISQVVFGDSQYDWVLAGVNVRASVNRNDSLTTTVGYAYLTAQLSFLLSQMANGALVMPTGGSPAAIVAAVTSGLSNYGVSQLVYDVMKETAIFYTLDGLAPSSNQLLGNVGAVDPTTSGILATVTAAIDPETLILNLTTLAANIPGAFAGSTFVGVGSNVVPPSGPTQVDSPSPADVGTVGNPIQFLQSANLAAGTDYADLTTFEGFGLFFRVIRIFYDFSRARNMSGTITAVNVPVNNPFTNLNTGTAPPVQKQNQQAQQKTQQIQQTITKGNTGGGQTYHGSKSGGTGGGIGGRGPMGNGSPQ